MNRSFAVVLAGVLAAVAPCVAPAGEDPTSEAPPPVQLGNFSVSLAVKDLKASRAFYEKLGFRRVAGDASKGWLVLRNGDARIGLFQGIIPRNSLTFNPGWDGSGQPLARFQDVREIQEALRAQGLVPAPAADPSSSGPAFFMLVDPDGNPILVDQHVPRTAR